VDRKSVSRQGQTLRMVELRRRARPCVSSRTSETSTAIRVPSRSPTLSRTGSRAHRPTGAASFDEGVTVDIQTLAILGEDEPVVLRLVEPQHRASHSWTFCLDARKIRIGCQFRRWHIGQSGNSPLRLMP